MVKKSPLQTKNALIKPYMGKKCGTVCKSLKIALLNAPCYGFGDVIFAQKLAKYLREWYKCKVDIFTTQPDAHIKLGENPKNLVKPVGLPKGKAQCSTFSSLKFPDKDKKYDLYFVAPLVADFKVNVNDVKKAFSNATKENVFFFSEYNSPTTDFDFPTGVGGKRCGIFLVKPPQVKKVAGLKNPYAMFYIASDEHIPNARGCYTSFIEMVSKKYHKKHKKLDIVGPEWVDEDLDGKHFDSFVKKIGKYYPHIVLKTKKETEHLTESGGNTLTLRLDVLPVDNKKMFSLMKYSLDDILLTGDQSITDVLSCCSKKNIFYQIASWKESFARELAKEMPNTYLKSKKTSCGTLKAISYNSNYSKFVKKWDFRIRAKPKMDAVVLAALEMRKNGGVTVKKSKRKSRKSKRKSKRKSRKSMRKSKRKSRKSKRKSKRKSRKSKRKNRKSKRKSRKSKRKSRKSKRKSRKSKRKSRKKSK